MNTQYSRTNPFFAPIKDRYSLCKGNSSKQTHHFVLDLQGSGISYSVGDCIAILPKNDPKLVQNILQLLESNGNELVFDKQQTKQGPLYGYLLHQANLSSITKKFITGVLSYTSEEARAQLQLLLSAENSEVLNNLLNNYDVLDFFNTFGPIQIPSQEFCNLLQPLLPRFYSISSSQRAVGNEVHLTVALVKYQTNGNEKHGTCTRYLNELAPLNEPTVPIYLHPHKGFTLPENPDVSIIMVGPGTGVAPFRAFMQERIHSEAKGKNWLFFGEWHRDQHFFYEDFWSSLETQGHVKLNLAFSRDQEHKIYVQNHMLAHAEELFHWIDSGAYFYVCGDAQRMAKDVEATLLAIFQQQGSMDESKARDYLKHLRKSGRYLRDVY